MTTVTYFFCCNIFVSILCNLLLTDKVKYSKLYYVKKKKQGVGNMKNWSFLNKFVLIAGLVLASQGFGAWDGVTKTRPSQDAKKVFIITNEAELAWFADTTNIKTGTGDQQFVVSARLESNLDMGNKYFTPICGGKGDKKFQGIFDGQQHVIRNVKYDGEELIERYNDERYGQNVGFVGAMSGGTVRNLIIENLNIHSSTNILEDGKENQISVGGIVGWMQNGTIDNCVTSGSIFTSGKGQGVGGIAGALWQGTISNCLSYVGIQVSGQDAQIGGIVGLTKKGTTVTIKSCVYAGTTLVNTGNGAVGGIVGQQKENGSLNIDDCYYDTDVVAKGVDKIKDSTKVTNNSHGVSDVNDGKSMCEANDGNWGVCSVANHNDETSCLQNEGVWYADSCSKEGAWSTGENSVSLNGYGADGYKITFDANGGIFPANAKKVKFLAAGVQITADEITMPYHTGAWAFAGWSLSKGENAVPIENLGEVSKPVTIYAAWKPVYVVTFDANPGVFPAVEGFAESATRTKSVAQGERITVEGIGDLPTRYCSDQGENGCNLYLYFTGWAYESIVLGEEDEPDDYTLDLKTINVEGSVNLKAVWTAVETYTVTFDANSHGKTKVSYVKVGKGEHLTKKLDPEADDGYVFGGWCLNEAPCENTFDFDTTTITQSINLVAAWSLDTFDIIYETDGGSNPEDNKVKYTVETESFSFSAPTRDGYDFDNWFYNYEDGVYSNKATQITKGTTGDKTLYAKWNKKKYIITYLAGNDGRGTINPDTLFHGGAITLKNSGDFTRKGYEQTAWITENAAQTFNLGAEYSANASITLLPKWKIIDYNITYILNAENATNNKDNKKTYRVNQNVSLKDPTRPGYTFGGWFDNEDLNGEPVTMIKQGSTGDKTFYAKWIPESVETQYGAITITESNTKVGGEIVTTRAAVINGNYGGADEPNLDEADAVEITSDITVNSVTLDRTFNAGKVATLYVPFEIDAENVVGTEVYKFKTVVKSDEDNRWKFKVSTANTIKPNTPYVIVPKGEQVTLDITDPVTLNTTTAGEQTTANYWEFVGAYQYEKFTLVNNDPIYLFANEERNGAKLGEFVKIADGAYINPMRAYLVYHKSEAMQKSASGNFGSGIALPDELDIEIENENGIVVQTGTLNTVTGEVRMDRWFDLKGRKLNAKPTTKGTYYKNGKRVIIK